MNDNSDLEINQTEAATTYEDISDNNFKNNVNQKQLFMHTIIFFLFLYNFTINVRGHDT